MAEKSPILQALELNTKAIQSLHGGLEDDRKTKPSGGGGVTPSADGDKKEPAGKPKEIKEVKGIGTHAKEEIAQRKKTVKSFIGKYVHKTSEFVKGDFLRKIPIMDKMGGNFIADILKRKRDDKRRFKKEQKEEEQRAKDEEDNEEKRYLATQARAAGKSKFKYEGEEYDESDYKEEEERQESDSESISDQEGLLATLVSLAQQTNRLLIEGLGVRSPGYLHDLLNLQKKDEKGDKLKDREELLEKKKDKVDKGKKDAKDKKGLSKLLDMAGGGISNLGGFLKGTMFPLLGSLATTIGPILLPIMAVALAAGLGLMVGNYIYKKFVEGWIDDFHQAKEDEMNRTHKREFKESKIITGQDEEGNDILENAYRVPEGHALHGKAEVIGETEARKHFEANKKDFDSPTFEFAVESGELEQKKYAVNVDDPTKLMSGQRIYKKDNRARAGLNDLYKEQARRAASGEAPLTPEEISDMKELVYAEFLKGVDQKLAESMSKGNPGWALKEVIKHTGIGNYINMIKKNKELLPEAKQRLLSGFKSSRMVEKSGIDPGQFDVMSMNTNRALNLYRQDTEEEYKFEAGTKFGAGVGAIAPIESVPTDIDATTKLDANKNLNQNTNGGGGDTIVNNHTNTAVDNSSISSSPVMAQHNPEPTAQNAELGILR